jgi:hypothetical protein
MSTDRFAVAGDHLTASFNAQSLSMIRNIGASAPRKRAFMPKI